MSRNLCSSSCECGRTVRLSDIRGKPLEIRRYGKYAPTFGVKWVCDCKQIYFVILRRRDTFWGREGLRRGDHLLDEIPIGGGRTIPNKERDRFVINSGGAHIEETGHFVLDLSHWHTYNDEPHWDPAVAAKMEMGEIPPRHTCLADALDTQLEW